MKVRYLSRIVLILILGLAFSAANGQDKKDAPEDLARRVTELEKQREQQKELYEEHKKLLKDNFKNKSDEMDNKYDLFKVIAALFGSLTIITIFSLYAKLKKRVLEIGDKKIEEKFDSLLEEKKSRIIAILKNHNEEMKLKNEKSILVLTPKGADDSPIKKFFKEMDFNLNLIYFESPDNLNKLNKVHLALFNNESGTFDHKEIDDIIRETKDYVFCLYFGRDRFISTRHQDRVSFANAKVQLYGNLINALRYQKLLE